VGIDCKAMVAEGVAKGQGVLVKRVEPQVRKPSRGRKWPNPSPAQVHTSHLGCRMCQRFRPVVSTLAGFPDPDDPENPEPEPAKTRTRESGSGFHRVRVGVALKQP